MRDAARKALRFAQGRTRADLESDELLALGLVKCIEIIGEAAAKVTSARRRNLPEIAWLDVVGMRHRSVHGYDQIDLDLVWGTVTDDLPGLVAILGRVLP